MSKKMLFAVRDNKAGYFMSPFCAVSAGYAERAFIDACNDSRTELSKHPEDYTLYRLGHYNELTGEVDSSVLSLINGLQAVNPVCDDDDEEDEKDIA